MSADQNNPPSAVRNPKSVAGRRHTPSVDSVTTINADGSRYFLYPADARGRFTSTRRWSAYALIAVYLLLPWITIGGAPAVFLDVAERRFHFFGFTLAAQDTWLLFFGVSGLGFALFFLTALFGRLWCGWACPQTVFLDHVYRRIERMLEGDAPARRARHNAPWTAGKIARVAAKHGLYILASLVITHLFLAYFVSLPELWTFMRSAPAENWAAFVFVFIAAGVLYFNFAWFREQLCIVICPYGRLQSALTDEHTMVIGYDSKRGEPRGHRKTEGGGRKSEVGGHRTDDGGQNTEDRGRKTENGRQRTEDGRSFPANQSSVLGTPSSASAAAALGDCVACNRCVQVCPTGIDIRHGLQLECIGCAACIDACDEVMTKVSRPKGLIRYDSLAGFEGKATRWLRSRTIVYGVLMLVGAAVATFAFSTVKPASFLVYRMTGSAYFVDQADVRNQFLVRLVNKRSAPAELVVTLVGLPPAAHRNGFDAPVQLVALGETVTPLVVTVDRKSYAGPFKFTVQVQDKAGTFTLDREVEFLGPDPRLLEEEDREKGIKR